jgi:transposase InsO family protein
VKFAFIQAEKAVFPVTVLCRVLGVSRAGFYAAQRHPVAARVIDDARLAVQIAAIHRASRRCYGSPRVHAELQAGGQGTSRKRVARLMRRAGLAARRRRAFRVTTQSAHSRPVAPNRLARQFTAPAPDRVWVTDITYLATVEGWLYLAVVLDLFSRRVVGWALSDRLGEGVALEALGMGLARRRPQPGLLHHSDRGSQYASAEYRAILAEHGMQCSMSGAGELLGQRGGRELLRDAEDGARPRRGLASAGRRAPRGVRLHRALLQRAAPALDARLSQSGGVRTAVAAAHRVVNLSTKAGQVHRTRRG